MRPSSFDRAEPRRRGRIRRRRPVAVTATTAERFARRPPVR